MKPVKKQLALLAACVALSATALPAAAAPGLLAKFVSQPAVVPGDPKSTLSPTTPELANYSDPWWVPSESGWGVNILQQGSAMVLVFYIFDDDQQPVWYRAVTSRQGDGSFQGVMYYDTGTSFREPVFGPIPSPAQQVGEIRFTPTTLYDAVVTYAIGSTTGSKQITRLAFAPQDFSGEHLTTVTARISACGEKSGDLAGITQTEAYVSSGGASITLASGGTSCVINGPFRQRGKLGQISGGSYSCSDGSSGQANVDAWDTQGGSFSAIVTTSSGTCSESGRIAGVRLQ